MRIDRIRLLNLNSLRQEVDINFEEAPLSQTGIFAIVGDTGAGKTTILDALTLALYGKVHRNKDTTEEVLSYGATECYAEVHFSVPDGQFMAQWSRKRAHNKLEGRIQDAHRQISRLTTKGWVVETSKKRECDKLIEAYSGLDYNRFTRSVLLSQGDFAAFLRADPRDRSALLERITGTDYYSKLSQAAFRKAKDEAGKVSQLEQQKSMLNLLDATEEKELRARQKELQKGSATREKQLRILRQQIVDHEAVLQLGKDFEELKASLEQWQQQKSSFKEYREALSGHDKALPLQPLVEKHGLLLSQMEELRKRFGVLSNRQKEVQETLKEKTSSIQELSSTVKELQKQEKATFALFDKITEFDQQISNLTEQHQRLSKQQEELRQEYEILGHEESQLKIKQTSLSTRQKEIDNWLVSNKHFGAIQDALPDLEGKWQVIQRLQYSQQQVKGKKDKQLSDKRSIQQTLKKVREEELQLETTASAMQEQLEVKWPALKELEPEQILQNEQRRLEQMRNQLQWMESARKLRELQSEFHQEYNAREEELQHLLNAEQHLRSNVMNTQELLEAAIEQEMYLRKVHLQQIRISGLEEHRQHLEKGEPCPLCLSTHHPFRDQDDPITPFVDESADTLAAAERKKETIRQQLRGLLGEERSLSEQIIHLAGDQEKGLEGRLDLIQRRINETEREMSDFLQLLKERGIPEGSDPETIRKELDQLSREQENFFTTLDKLKEARASLRTSNEKRKELEWRLGNVDSQLGQIEKEEQTLEEEILQKTKDLQKMLDPFGQKAALENEFLSVLREQLVAFSQQEQARQEAVVQLDQIAISLREKGSQRSTKKNQLETIIKELTNLAATRNEKQAERQTLFGDKKPSEERDRWNAQLRKQTEALNVGRTLAVRLEEELVHLDKQLKEIQQDSKQKEDQLKTMGDELHKKATQKGFLSIEALQEALLSDEKAANWKMKVTAYDREGQELETSQKNNVEQLQKAKAKLTDIPSAEDLREQLKVGEEEQMEEQQQLGSIQNQLKANSEKKDQQKQLLKEIEAQRKEFIRWEKLNALIGSSDGKKFRVFAQGLTLEKLVQLANQHLQDLNGRYTIQTKKEAELELEIIDTYQANHCRSMNTLSGGESFLVSLALALGLSDLAGRKTQIRSLFIDEGFGTLDESTLDLALTTLENLQASGKIIGVISHVKELKERISTQLQVIKGANGFSEVHIRG